MNPQPGNNPMNLTMTDGMHDLGALLDFLGSTKGTKQPPTPPPSVVEPTGSRTQEKNSDEMIHSI